MKRRLSLAAQSFPIDGKFTISRGSRTHADVILCEIEQDGRTGRGECVPYKRYGETIESVLDSMGSVRQEIESGMDNDGLLRILPAGAARNALDCALWDLRAKLESRPAHTLLGLGRPPAPLETAYTISLASPEEMALQTRRHAHRPLLKIKVGGDGDIKRMQAVAENAPAARIIVDANEAWTPADIEANLAAAAQANVALVEQPLPAGQDAMLRDIDHPVPVCADESVHLADDLDALVGLYDCVNIKLDKSGGLTAGLALRDAARARGFRVMVGCMVGTSLAMAPAVLLAQGADFVDLDGPLLLARDRDPGLRYEGSLLFPPEPSLWG